MNRRVRPLNLAWIGLLATLFVLSELGGAGRVPTSFLRERVVPELSRVDAFFTDLKFRLRGARPPRNKIVIVEIDDKALAEVGRWPWPRDLQTLLLRQIYSGSPAVVGMDVIWSEPETRVPDAIVEFLRSAKQSALLDRVSAEAKLEREVRKRSGSLVLGWETNSLCIPAFNECPDPVGDIPPEFSRFGLFSPAGAPRFPRPRLFSAARLMANLPGYNAVATHQGFTNVLRDRDGIARHALLTAQVGDQLQPSLALAMARSGLGDEVRIRRRADGSLEPLRWNVSGRRIAANALGVADLNYRGPEHTFTYLSAGDVLREDDRVRDDTNGRISGASRAAILRDAYVLVGVTALAVGDVHASPFDKNLPGVEAQATALDNLLSGDFLRTGEGGWGTWLLLAAMTLGAYACTAAVGHLPAILMLAATGTLLIALGFVDAVMFARSLNPHTGFLYIELAGMILIHLADKYVEEEQGRRYIRYAFSRYLSPAVVDQIARDPELLKMGGQKRELTILFSDIRGFTTFSETMDAKTLGEFLNAYLDRMTDIVFDSHGTLDKYIGDALMAFWGAPVQNPNHALNACVAARRMMETLEAERPRLKAKYGVDVQIGIGINSGSVSVGNMGSSKSLGYTVIGDAVNLASRLEGATKAYGVSILTTRATLDSIESAGGEAPPHRVLDRLKVKGKDTAVEIVQILDRKLDPAGLALFQEARRAYSERRWDEAIDLFRRASALLGRDERGDAACAVFVGRCEEFRAHAPKPDWDGSWKMDTK